jgi:glycosyltransferase involved in cell wall biosynthesis
VRILFGALAMPFPPTNGHRLRTWALLRALAEEGHDLTLVSFAEPGELHREDAELRAVCKTIERVPVPGNNGSGRSEFTHRLLALASRYPYGAWRFRSPAFVASMQRNLAGRRFDLVICDGIYNVQNLPRGLTAPILLNKDDVAHIILEHYVRLERNPLTRLYVRLEAQKVKRWEQQACAGVTANLVCSEVDREILERLCPGVPMLVIPNVVDTNHYAPAGDGEPLTVLFQGGMDWHPNRDAVEFFAAEILPELRRLVPAVTFRVAGRSPSDDFRRRFAGAPGLEFTGTVPDMRAEIARATVCVVPLRIGSGTRLKILEAAAMGKAIVSTRLGAEGLEFRDQKDILLADEPRGFAGMVAQLLEDAPRRLDLGRAARRCVEKQYSGHALRASLREALQAVATGMR